MYTTEVVQRRTPLAGSEYPHMPMLIHAHRVTDANSTCPEHQSVPSYIFPGLDIPCDRRYWVDHEMMRRLFDDMLPNAARIVGETFYVRPVSPQLVLRDPDGLHHNRRWQNGAPPFCGHVRVRGTSLEDQLNDLDAGTSASTVSATFPQRPGGQFGIDLLVLVTVLPVVPQESWGWGGPCVVDSDTGLTRVGFLNVNPMWLSPRSANTREQVISFLVHELIHILGFSPMIWSQSWGTSRNPASLDRSAEQGWYAASDQGIRRFVEKHVGCSSEFTNITTRPDQWFEDADAGYSVLHWEKKLFLGEVMTNLDPSLDVSPLALSELTVSYFEAMQTVSTFPISADYVTVTRQRTEQLVWGRNRGCEFLERSCRHLAGNTSYPEFCTAKKNHYHTCAWHHHARGDCNVEDLTVTIPPGDGQPFDSPLIGSTSTEMGFCPVVAPDVYCTDVSNTPSVPGFETFGPASRCVNTQTYQAVCLSVCCGPRDDGSQGHRVYLDVPHKYTGEIVVVACDESGKGGGYGGASSVLTEHWDYVFCPEADLVCSPSSADSYLHTGGIRLFDVRPEMHVPLLTGVSVLLTVGLTVPVGSDANLTVAFPLGGYYMPYDGDVRIERVEPTTHVGDVGPMPAYDGAPLATWYSNTLSIVFDSTRHCGVHTWKIYNMTSPDHRGDYGVYTLQLFHNGTAYPESEFNPPGDDMKYTRVTQTTTNTITPHPTTTPLATPTLTHPPTTTPPPTPTVSLTRGPPTTTIFRTPSATPTATYLPPLPCYCYGHGNCVVDPYPFPYRDPTRVLSSCACEYGYGGRFCQLEICGQNTCGRWSQCTALEGNTSVPELHFRGATGRSPNPRRDPVPWLIEPNVERGVRDHFSHPDVWAPDASSWSREGFFNSEAGVDALGWFHLCPDSPYLDDLNLTLLTIHDVASGRLVRAPYQCTRLRVQGGGQVGQFASEEVAVGGALYNVTSGWLSRGMFVLTANLTNATESANLTFAATGPHRMYRDNDTGFTWFEVPPEYDIKHEPFDERNFSKVRMLFAADYASDDRTSWGLKDVDFAMDVDAHRLSFWDPYFRAYRHRYGATPYPRRVRVHWNRDSGRQTPVVTHVLVPGSVLEWLQLYPEDAYQAPLTAFARPDEVPDKEVLMGVPLWSQHLFVSFGAPWEPERTADYVLANLLVDKAFTCHCTTNSSTGIPVYVDVTDPRCQRCVVFADGTRAYPPGDCTLGCPCENGGYCDHRGDCVCLPHFEGATCQHCKSNWYPTGHCNVFCDPSTTCLGRGLCDGLGRCVCGSAFAGDRCETTACRKDLQERHHVLYQCNNPEVCTANMDCGLTPLREAHCWVGNSTPPARFLQWAGGDGRPQLFGVEQTPRYDYDEYSHMWMDGGWDTFDGWGNFSICSDEMVGCLPIPELDGEGRGAPADPEGWKQATHPDRNWHPNVTVRQFTVGSTQLQLRHGWVNRNVFMLMLEVDYGADTWVEFGGRYGSGPDATFQGPNTHFREIPTAAGVESTLVVVHTRTVLQTEGRPGVSYAVATPTGQSVWGTAPLDVKVTGPGHETVKTPSMVAGGGAPLLVMVTWGDRVGQPGFEEQMVRSAASLAASGYGARCIKCPSSVLDTLGRAVGPRGGTWCDRCRTNFYPPPVFKWNPPNFTNPENYKHDSQACLNSCDCAAPDNDVPCDENGNCRCRGRRVGRRCTECQPDWYPWPECNVYCNAAFTCSGRGSCSSQGRCECTAGYQGFSCHLAVCGGNDCGGVTHGRSVCASPTDAPFRLLWLLGKRDGSNAEFKKDLLRSVEQGAVSFNLSSHAHAQLPGAFAGPDLAAGDNAFGLDVDEFNPFTVHFFMPEREAQGYCWVYPAGGEPHYTPHGINNEAECKAENGRWDPAWWCYDSQQERFVFYDNPPRECGLVNLAIDRSHEIKRHLFDPVHARYSISIGMMRPSLGPMNMSEVMGGELRFNGHLLYEVTQKTFDLEIEVPVDWINWGFEENNIRMLLTRGGEIHLDYIQFSVSGRSAEDEVRDRFRATTLRPFIPDPARAAHLNFDNQFQIAVDLRREGARGLQYFAVGGGLRHVDSSSPSFVSMFDRYGMFRVCLDLVAECVNLHLNDGDSLLEWFFQLGGQPWVLKSGFTVNGIFMLQILQQRGEYMPFSLSFGGTYTYTPVPRQWGTFNQRAVVNNYPFVIPCLWNSAGPRDSLIHGPQLFVAVLPYDANNTHGDYDNAESVNRFRTTHRAHSRAENTNHSLDEYVRVTDMKHGASVFLQWGYAHSSKVLEYIFGTLDALQRPTCSCMPPFSGEDCGTCTQDPGKLFCNYTMCRVEELCGCSYPTTTDPTCTGGNCTCQACLPGYTKGTGENGVPGCVADCSAVANCSQRGVCYRPGICRCYPGFYGTKCDRTLACLKECIGDSTDSRYGACETVSCYAAPQPGQDVVTALCPYGCQHGTCSRATRSCTCNPGWFGLDCSEPICLGGASCYGHGICTGTQQCRCQEGWTGADCETSTCALKMDCGTCIAEEGCGWCSLTGKCLPGDRNGPYTPTDENGFAVTLHVCTAEPTYWRLSECYMGLAPGVATRAVGVPLLNCSFVCDSVGGDQCTLCQELTPSDSASAMSVAGGRRLLQTTITPVVTATKTPRPRTTTKVPPTTTLPQISSQEECQSKWQRWPWMWDSLVENLVCACTLERQRPRDAKGTCMEEFIWDDLQQYPVNLTSESVRQKEAYASALVDVEQQVTCCSANDVCCVQDAAGEFTALRTAEANLAQAVDWYATNIVPLHIASHHKARVHCGCSSLCVSHQRESVWRMLMQAVPQCMTGSPANVLMHPCELTTASDLRTALKSHFEPIVVRKRCPMDTVRRQETLGFAQTRTQEATLIAAGSYTLPTCAHWTADSLWGCCSTLLRCYSNCTKGAHICNKEFVDCAMSRYQCTALLGVKQLVVEVPEESSEALKQKVEVSFTVEEDIKRLACPCVRQGIDCDRGVFLGDSCVCFEGWAHDADGLCRIPACPMQCSGHGHCLWDAHGVTQCHCDFEWEGPHCSQAKWSTFRAFGLGHVITWDQLHYRFYGDGSFNLCRAATPAGMLDIQAHMTPHPESGASAMDGISIRLGPTQVDVWTKPPDTACVGMPAQPPRPPGAPPGVPTDCLRGRLLARVNGEPLLEPYSWRYWAWPNLIIYSVQRFHDTTFFVRLPSLVKVKVGAVWSSVARRYVLNVVVTTQGHRVRGGGKTDGLCGVFDGDAVGDIQDLKRPDGGRLKNFWTDFHTFGELSRLPVEASFLPFAWSRPVYEGIMPLKHAYHISTNFSEVPSIVPHCEHLDQPYRSACDRDMYLINDTGLSANEFYDALSYCDAPGGLSECSLNGACDPAGGMNPRCLCPEVLNGSSVCADVQEVITRNDSFIWEQLRELVVTPALFYGPNEWGPWLPSDGSRRRRADSLDHPGPPPGVPHDTAHPLCWQLNFCSGHGTCVRAGTPRTVAENSSLPVCVCNEDYEGIRCELPHCSEPCGAHGVCAGRPYRDGPDLWEAVAMKREYIDPPPTTGIEYGDGEDEGQGCRCAVGYGGSSGRDCGEAALCLSVKDCNGHGVCDGPDSCRCFNGWTGSGCDVEESGHCSAQSQLGGRWCVVPECDCSGHGLCSIVQNQRVCVCDQNWFGSSCSNQCVAAVTCSGHGSCGSTGRCECQSPYRTSRCDIKDPTAPTPVKLQLTSKPASHPQGTELQLGVLIDGGTTRPLDKSGTRMYLEWISSPVGLFSPDTQNNVNVRVPGEAWRCDNRQQVRNTDLMSTCQYTIRVEIYAGLSLRSQDNFTLTINTAPTPSCPPRFNGRCPLVGIESQSAQNYEAETQVSLNAGMWRDEQVPFTYRFAYKVAGTEYAVLNGETLGFRAQSRLTMRLPALPCAVSAAVSTVTFLVYVRDTAGAVSPLALPWTFEDQGNATVPVTAVPVTRLSDQAASEILDREQQDLSSSTHSGSSLCGTAIPVPGPNLNRVSVVLRLTRRQPVENWRWELVQSYIVTAVHHFDKAAARSLADQEFLAELFSDVMDMREMSVYPDAPLSCGVSAQVGGNTTIAVGSARFQNYTNFLSCTGNKIAAELLQDGVALSTDVAKSVMETAGRLTHWAEQASLIERLQSVIDQPVAVAKVEVSIVQSTLAQTTYTLQDGHLYSLNTTFPGAGKTLATTYIDPGAREASGEYKTLDGSIKSFSVSLLSPVFSYHFRDPFTGQDFPVAGATSDPIVVVMFTLATDIPWSRGFDSDSGYKCVFWEDGKWHWGKSLGVGNVVPSSSIQRNLVGAALEATTYGCAVTHLSMWALADVRQIVPGTPEPSGSIINHTLTPQPPIPTTPPIPITSGGMPARDVLAITVGVTGGAVPLVFIAMAVSIYLHKRKKRRLLAEEAARRFGLQWKDKALAAARRRRRQGGGKAVRFAGAQDQEEKVPDQFVHDSRNRQRVMLRRLAQNTDDPQDNPLESSVLGSGHEDPMALPEPPDINELRHDLTMDAFLAQRDEQQIEQVLRLDDLQEYDPADPIGQRKYAYPVEGDSASEEEEEYVEPSAPPAEAMYHRGTRAVSVFGPGEGGPGARASVAPSRRASTFAGGVY